MGFWRSNQILLIMSQNNINTVFTAFAIAATAPLIQGKIAESLSAPIGNYQAFDKQYKSGAPMMYYTHATEEYVKTQHSSNKVELSSIEMQTRYQAMKSSFAKYNKCFPVNKQVYFSQMANALCKLEFRDNVFFYNEADSCIDTVLKLRNGLTLSVSCFLDEDMDTPMVFSLHRGKSLLVSDAMPIGEIVKTINSATA